MASELDYCCGGKQSFAEACIAKGFNSEQILREIGEAARTSAADRDWQTAPLHELVTHIVETHHAYLKLDLPVLEARIDKVVAVHSARDPQNLPRLAEVSRALRSELECISRKKKTFCFRSSSSTDRAELQKTPVPRQPFGSIANPIAVMEREHHGAGDALEEIRALTGNYNPPPYACATVRALYAGLEALEKDLHIHIHLENNVLFPRAIALEQA